jgi:alanine racemase
MTIGVLPLGYHEGIDRSLSNVGSVKIGNNYCPIVGRVCMNHTMIDISHIKTASRSEAITIYSSDRNDDNSIDSIAEQQTLFSYSIVTNLSPDIRRLIVA